MTRYFVKYQPTNGERANVVAFDSLTMRVIWILDHALDVTVLSTWEGR